MVQRRRRCLPIFFLCVRLRLHWTHFQEEIKKDKTNKGRRRWNGEKKKSDMMLIQQRQ
jgi:hypothetical protein